MPLLGFQSRFAPLVESGQKRQTIRAYRKNGRDPKPGDRLYLYTGLRQKWSRKLGEATCARVYGVELNSQGALSIDGRPIYPKAFNRIARDDGFNGTADLPPMYEMIEWFQKNHSLPFRGLLIEWDEIEEGEA